VASMVGVRAGAPAVILADMLVQALRQAALTVQEMRAIERDLALVRAGWQLRCQDAQRIRRYLRDHGDVLTPQTRDAAHTVLLELLQGGL
jgi:hypothetical protein